MSTRVLTAYILFIAYSYQYKYCINDKIYVLIMLKILVCTHHGCNHLLQQTVARTLKHTVEAATSMIVATPTNDQENCNNNSINPEVILLLPLCSCYLLATVVWSHHFVAAIIISVVNVASCMPSLSLFHPPLLHILHPLSPSYLPLAVQHTALWKLLQK